MGITIVKASVFWLIGFFVYTYAWYWYWLRPSQYKAIGAGAMRAAIYVNPIYWASAFAVSFACSALYLFIKYR